MMNRDTRVLTLPLLQVNNAVTQDPGGLSHMLIDCTSFRYDCCSLINMRMVRSLASQASTGDEYRAFGDGYGGVIRNRGCCASVAAMSATKGKGQKNRLCTVTAPSMCPIVARVYCLRDIMISETRALWLPNGVL